MRKSIIILLSFVVAAFPVLAGIRSAKSEPDSNWASKPQLHTLPKEYVGEPAVILTESENVAYKLEGRGTSIYRTLHRLIKINDERGVEAFSTCTIPFYSGAYIEDLKARTITSSGKVVDVPMYMFKEGIGNDGAPVIKFALEGVTRNAEVEIFVKLITPYNAFGGQELQYSVPVMNFNFELSYPRNFLIEHKGYNGCPDMQDTLIHGRRHMSMNLKNIPGFKPEPYSFFRPHAMRMEWRISYWNDDNGNEGRLFTWDEYAKQLYHDVFMIPDGKTPFRYFLTPNGRDLYRNDAERKAVNNFLSGIGVTGSELELEKILKIERGIKSKIGLHTVVNDRSGRLDTIISRHSATPYGYLKLFAACFAQTDVKCEIGITTNRREHSFSADFENWNYLSDYVFYFPNQKQYLSPMSRMLRYPMVPDEVLGNKAVFCKMSTPSEARPRVADIRTIPEGNANDNAVVLNCLISFRDLKPEMTLNYAYNGAAAVPARSVFAQETANEERRRLLEEMLPGVFKPSDLQRFSITNISADSYFTKAPLLINAKIKPSRMMEHAGGKYLFQIGELLGSVTEMYENTERKLPIDIDYPYVKKMTFQVNIPAGYHVRNLSSFRTEYKYFNSDDPRTPVAAFTSDYKLKGNKLVITADVLMSYNHFRVREYDPIRKVINSVADFSRQTLVLSK
jgi:hypothetical protein